MDKETAKKFEKDLATLLERYGMKKKDSELRYGIHTTIPESINDIFWVTHTLEFYESLNDDKEL